jgi:hypothetical protein
MSREFLSGRCSYELDLRAQSLHILGNEPLQLGIGIEIAITAAVHAEWDMDVNTIRCVHFQWEYNIRAISHRRSAGALKYC